MPPEENRETESAYLASRYAKHLMGCAEIADSICDRFGIHEDAARQACFATIVIDAKDRFIFQSDDEKDLAAAEKADAQIADAPRKPTPEQAEEGASKALREGVKQACLLLNQEGFIPPLSSVAKNGTPSTLDQYITRETQLGKPYAEMDSEDLEALAKNLSLKLDVVRANGKALEGEVGF